MKTTTRTPAAHELIRALSPTGRRLALKYAADGPGACRASRGSRRWTSAYLAEVRKVCFRRGRVPAAEVETLAEKVCFRRGRVPAAEVETLAEKVYAAAQAVHDARAARLSQRRTRLGLTGRRGVLNETISRAGGHEALVARNWARTRAVAEECLRRADYRLPTGSAGTVEVVEVDTAQVGVGVAQYKDWNTYCGSFKGWGHLNTDVTLRIARRWRSRVHAHGIAVADGLLTLDATPLEGTPEGVQAYAATWMEQRRGYEFAPVRGVLARHGALFCHATGDAAFANALRGLARKASAQSAAKTWRQVAALNGRAVERLLKVAPATARVTIGDAAAEGACLPGIQSWVYAAGLGDYWEAGEAPLGEVWGAYHRLPSSYARAAILRACRRVRACRVEAERIAQAAF